MKVSIVGGSGVVGSSAAYRLAQDGHCSEIVLVDIRRNLAEAHALDIEQAMAFRTTANVRGGDLEDAAASDVIILTASAPRPEVEISRRDYLSVNLPLILDTVRPLRTLAPSALFMLASSPVDPLVYLLHRACGVPRDKTIGLNRNDTARFRWAIAKVLAVPFTAVEAFVLGEHGDSQVPLFSSIKIEGRPVALKQEEKERVTEEMAAFFVKWNQLMPGRTAGWTSAESIGDILASMALDDGRLWPCSACLDGKYGLRDVSLGVPVRLRSGKIKEIVELDLDPSEKEALEASARVVKEMIGDGEALLRKG